MIIFRMKPLVIFGTLPPGDEFCMYLSGNYVKMITNPNTYKPDSVDRNLFLGCYILYRADGPSKNGFIYKTVTGHVKIMEEWHLVDRLKRPLTPTDIAQVCETLSEPVTNIRHLLEFISL